jgi:gamma-aminobutyric acid receptor subunit alpha
VDINMAVRSIGPIDEINQVYSLDCYFRQSWSDPRLRFNTTGVDQLALNWQFLTMVGAPPSASYPL